MMRFFLFVESSGVKGKLLYASFVSLEKKRLRLHK